MNCVLQLCVLSLVTFSGTVAVGPYSESNCFGNRVAITHLFEWKWNDIAEECERFLGPMGYCGVQVSPPSENVPIGAPEPERPWWERYQPVSYLLETRSGTESEFQSMVERCNAVSVRVYVDAVINHMSGVGRRGTGTGESSFDADLGDFPGVPYTMSDFNDCTNCGGCCCINAWQDHDMVRNCRLLGLIDLDPKVAHAEDMIVGYLNKLIGYGVAGFRIDAGKHMWPDDLMTVFDRTDDLRIDVFGAEHRMFAYLEVIDMNQNGEVSAHEYTHIGRVTEFRYCNKIHSAAGSLWEIPGLYDAGWGMVAPSDAFVFVDNHDNQRGHGAGGTVITHIDPRMYKIAQAITLSQDYGWPRVMSSYYFSNTDEGPPHHANYSTKDVPINPDGSCGDGWVCEHRWQAIAGMAGFAKAAKNYHFTNWWNDGNKAAYSRGDRAFIVITNEGTLDQTFYTGLPAGDYCNVIEGCPTPAGCSGKTVSVDAGGNARIIIDNYNEPIAAIHIEAMARSSTACVDTGSGGGGETTTAPPAPTTTPDSGDPNLKRTVIFYKAITQPGEDLFILGGISHDKRPGCTSNADTSDCAIYISHNSLGTTLHYDKMNAWSVNNNRLNWYGAQANQGTYQGVPAEGTPLVWTTSSSSNPGYQPDNSWGDHYWKVDFTMDCSETENDWFEFKGFVSNGAGWEADISQGACGGTAGGTAPYSGNNHMARCGYLNVFEFGLSSCTINNF